MMVKKTARRFDSRGVADRWYVVRMKAGLAWTMTTDYEGRSPEVGAVNAEEMVEHRQRRVEVLQEVDSWLQSD